MNGSLVKYELLPTWKQYLYSILNYLISLFIILGSMSVFNQTIDREYHIMPICAILVGIHLIVFPVVFQKVHIRILILFAIIWAVYLSIYAFVIPYDNASLIKKFGIMFLLLFVYYYSQHITDNSERVLRYYVNVILVIALISLFLWVTASTLKWFHSTGPVMIDWGAERKAWGFYNLYFHWQNDFFIHGHRFMRNIGIFTEAPMYSLHLCIALMIDALLIHSLSMFRWVRMIIISITVATTFSITGYLLVMIIWIYLVYNGLLDMIRSNDPKTVKKGKWLFVAVSLIGLLLIIVGGILVRDKLASRSGGTRLEDYKIGFLAWREKPFFGYGYNNQEARLQYASWRRLNRAEKGYTNSPMAILCEGGVYFFSAYVLPIVYGIYSRFDQKKWNSVLFLVLFLYLFTVTIFHHSLLIVSFLAFIYADFVQKEFALRIPDNGVV